MKKTISKQYLQKQKQVDSFVQEITKANSLVIVSIKGMPSKQFQEIKKSLRSIASVKVAKKNIMTRTIDNLKKEGIDNLKEAIKENCAFIISNKEGFELALELNKKKIPVFAKAGQIAPIDIEVKDGPTDLVPGPAISELGAIGLEITVENGKIAIKKAKVVVRKGAIIKENVSSILQKLGIQPFSISLETVAIYDVKRGKVYDNISINPEEIQKSLIECSTKALGFAQRIKYYCKETVVYFLVKANSEAKYLTKYNTQLNLQEDKA
jgi:large subunit ribosomal protein L10